MARKTKEEAQRTRDAILDAAESVFLARGISAATMADIADSAGVSRGAVYGHYANKMEVCIAMCMRGMACEAVNCDVDSERSAMRQLYEVLYNFLYRFDESGSFRRVLEILHTKCEETEENQPILDFLREWRRQGKVIGERLLRMAIIQGELPGDLNIAFSMKYIRSLMSGICDTVFCSEDSGESRQYKEYGNLLKAGLDALFHSPQFRKSNP